MSPKNACKEKKQNTRKNGAKPKKNLHEGHAVFQNLVKLEIVLAASAIFAFFVWLSLYSYQKTSMKGGFITGRIGLTTANYISAIFGYSGFFLPVLMSLLFLLFVYRKLFRTFLIHILFFLFLLPLFAWLGKDPLNWGTTGGWIGAIMHENFMNLYFGEIGSLLLYSLVFILYFALTIRLTLLTFSLKTTLHLKDKLTEFLRTFPGFSFLKIAAPQYKEDPLSNRIAFENEPLPIFEQNDFPPELEGSENETVFPEEIAEEVLPFEKEKDIDVIDHVEIPKKTRKTALRQLNNFNLPPLSILAEMEVAVASKDREKKIRDTALVIEKKLLQHKVKVSIAGAVIGPVVTMYELSLGDGIRVNQVSNMEQDLGIVVGGKRVRVVPRLPGKPYIGIEVPNEDSQIIRLREMLDIDQFHKLRSKGLPIALGHTVEGKPMVANLAKMPHLLVAGTTGSGKSVGVNTIIISFLYNMTPDEVKFIMIDPKANEFNIYDGIPHLLLPVVTDPKKAAMALKWAVDEMESRYRILAENMVRDIASYNQKIENINKNLSNKEDPILKMPYIVVIIDEFADLMTVAGKDVEIAVMRIAQKARAAGIHLIIATQRPTRDVITGTIKANLPVRIAFRVASALDSRMILDTKGAELLLGNGDMLYIPPGSSEPIRVHGAYVSTEEIKEVVKFIKDQIPEGASNYDDSIKLSSSPEEYIESNNNIAEDSSDRDPLYDEIIMYIRKTRKCSASMLQRQFKIGYNRAARVVDQLEAEGLIGAGDGAKPRQVLILEND